ncbi:hypothetical protein [Autumnicola psychrophila]|uniref:Uncharacterized protein n=1 Tax=Autumnicola psychrophila TaxID=3075592 RepID=A0ABU3DVU9_9FLAO|nr:hypothetical protein [Zunongwangia sp. F225]MDT0687834.1 hypothetical protein [Zunongwangia sp. F225]
MTTPHPHQPTKAFIFDRIQFLEDKFIEAGSVDPYISHPLHLFILKYLQINPVVLRGAKGIRKVKCLKEVNTSEIDNYSEFRWLSRRITRFVEKYLSIIEHHEPVTRKSRKDQPSGLSLSEKLEDHLLNPRFLLQEPEKRIAVIKGCIDFYEMQLRNKPSHQWYPVMINFLKKEKASLLQIIEGEKENLVPSNKSLLFNGKKLNLTERIRIANEVLDFEGQIRKLNISDTEKYQLMAYIMGNDTSNIRNVVNGTRPNKIREKEINSYLKDLMK